MLNSLGSLKNCSIIIRLCAKTPNESGVVIWDIKLGKRNDLNFWNSLVENIKYLHRTYCFDMKGKCREFSLNPGQFDARYPEIRRSKSEFDAISIDEPIIWMSIFKNDDGGYRENVTTSLSTRVSKKNSGPVLMIDMYDEELSSAPDEENKLTVFYNDETMFPYVIVNDSDGKIITAVSKESINAKIAELGNEDLRSGKAVAPSNNQQKIDNLKKWGIDSFSYFGQHNKEAGFAGDLKGFYDLPEAERNKVLGELIEENHLEEIGEHFEHIYGKVIFPVVKMFFEKNGISEENFLQILRNPVNAYLFSFFVQIPPVIRKRIFLDLGFKNYDEYLWAQNYVPDTFTHPDCWKYLRSESLLNDQTLMPFLLEYIRSGNYGRFLDVGAVQGSSVGMYRILNNQSEKSCDYEVLIKDKFEDCLGLVRFLDQEAQLRFWRVVNKLKNDMFFDEGYGSLILNGTSSLKYEKIFESNFDKIANFRSRMSMFRVFSGMEDEDDNLDSRRIARGIATSKENCFKFAAMAEEKGLDKVLLSVALDVDKISEIFRALFLFGYFRENGKDCYVKWAEALDRVYRRQIPDIYHNSGENFPNDLMEEYTRLWHSIMIEYIPLLWRDYNSEKYVAEEKYIQAVVNYSLGNSVNDSVEQGLAGLFEYVLRFLHYVPDAGKAMLIAKCGENMPRTNYQLESQMSLLLNMLIESLNDKDLNEVMSVAESLIRMLKEYHDDFVKKAGKNIDRGIVILENLMQSLTAFGDMDFSDQDSVASYRRVRDFYLDQLKLLRDDLPKCYAELSVYLKPFVYNDWVSSWPLEKIYNARNRDLSASEGTALLNNINNYRPARSITMRPIEEIALMGKLVSEEEELHLKGLAETSEGVGHKSESVYKKSGRGNKRVKRKGRLNGNSIVTVSQGVDRMIMPEMEKFRVDNAVEFARLSKKFESAMSFGYEVYNSANEKCWNYDWSFDVKENFDGLEKCDVFSMRLFVGGRPEKIDLSRPIYSRIEGVRIQFVDLRTGESVEPKDDWYSVKYLGSKTWLEFNMPANIGIKCIEYDLAVYKSPKIPDDLMVSDLPKKFRDINNPEFYDFMIDDSFFDENLLPDFLKNFIEEVRGSDKSVVEVVKKAIYLLKSYYKYDFYAAEREGYKALKKAREKTGNTDNLHNLELRALEESKKGVCQNYARLLVMVLRRCGIPAATRRCYKVDENCKSVSSNNAHQDVLLYLPSRGGIDLFDVDATPLTMTIKNMFRAVVKELESLFGRKWGFGRRNNGFHELNMEKPKVKDEDEKNNGSGIGKLSDNDRVTGEITGDDCNTGETDNSHESVKEKMMDEIFRVANLAAYFMHYSKLGENRKWDDRWRMFLDNVDSCNESIDRLLKEGADYDYGLGGDLFSSIDNDLRKNIIEWAIDYCGYRSLVSIDFLFE